MPITARRFAVASTIADDIFANNFGESTLDLTNRPTELKIMKFIRHKQ